MGKLALMYQCFDIQARFQDESCLQSKFDGTWFQMNLHRMCLVYINNVYIAKSSEKENHSFFRAKVYLEPGTHSKFGHMSMHTH